MNENTKEILFKEEVPHDLFVSQRSILVYDVEKNANTGDEVFFPEPYNVAAEEAWSTLPEEKALCYLVDKSLREGYVVRIPEYRGERFALLIEKGGRRIILVFCLDSESERKVWLAEELRRSYSIVIIRDHIEEEQNGAVCVTLDQALGSFNFQSV